MSARIIYLDQNKWIDLARSAAGPGDDFTPAVEFVRAARAAGAAVFPLSAAHYIESNKQHDDERFERLGRFMHEISGTVTMTGPVAIVRHEIEMAFLRALPHRIEVQPFSLLGRGVGPQSAPFSSNDWPEEIRQVTIPSLAATGGSSSIQTAVLKHRVDRM